MKLAELLDISREHLAKIETTKRTPSLNLIFKLSEKLEIQLDKLFKI